MPPVRVLSLLLFVPSFAAAEPIPVKEERLGAWHYLYPLEYYSGGGARHHRTVSTPTVVSFGATRDRVAMFLPGAKIVAEFRAKEFHDLLLPDQWLPLSLATDRHGNLWCLVQHSARFLHGPDDGKNRWAVVLGPDGWDGAIPLPYPECHRLEFDSSNRLWVLGPTPIVGCLTDGDWKSFTYSNDRKPQFLPLRLAEESSGDVVLFAYSAEPSVAWKNAPHLAGALVFDGENFRHEPSRDTSALLAAEKRRSTEPPDDPAFTREHGYVCRAEALNTRRSHPSTVLRALGHVFVGLGSEGLIWADAAELAAAPPLDSGDWESLNDITVPPEIDPAGHLWVGRGSKFVKVGPAEVETAAGDLPPTLTRDCTIDFDPLGRPWVMRWHGSTDSPVAVADHGTLRQYDSFAAALAQEGAAFQPGRIFPFALKNPSGLLAFGGGYFESFTLIDSRGPRAFDPRQISHLPEPKDIPRHGYNPCRNGEPWFDDAGRIYTRVDGAAYFYNPTRRSWSPAKGPAEPGPGFPPAPQEPGPIVGPFRTQVKIPAPQRRGRIDIVFHGFHFFAVSETGEERQLDEGLNPLALYPFWSGWYDSPGMTTPVLDPTGRLWISSLGPYADSKKWQVLRKPAW